MVSDDMGEASEERRSGVRVGSRARDRENRGGWVGEINGLDELRSGRFAKLLYPQWSLHVLTI